MDPKLILTEDISQLIRNPQPVPRTVPRPNSIDTSAYVFVYPDLPIDVRCLNFLQIGRNQEVNLGPKICKAFNAKSEVFDCRNENHERRSRQLAQPFTGNNKVVRRVDMIANYVYWASNVTMSQFPK